MNPRISRLSALLGAIWALTPTTSPAAEEEKPWPKQFRARPAKVLALEPPEGVRAAYQTAHFRLLSDDPIGPESLKRFATIIESIPLILQGFPLPLWAPPGKNGEKPIVRLCGNEISYQLHGGPGRSPGFYSGRKQEIIIRADVFLNPPQVRPSRLRPKPNEELLVHELTHLGMHWILAKSQPWFYEGTAEYVAAAHRGGGNYSFGDMDRSIRDHVRRYLIPGKDGTIPLPALSEVMGKTSKQWSATNQFAENNDPIRQYAAALLLVHYQFHGKTRRAKVRSYLDRLAAHRDWRVPLPRLTTEPPAEIEARLQRYWFPKGLNLKFAKAARHRERP